MLTRFLYKLRDGHTWLIKAMQAFEYNPNPKGICYGVTCEAVEEFLSYNLTALDERLSYINKTPPEEIRQQLEALEQKQVLFFKEARAEALHEWEEGSNLNRTEQKKLLDKIIDLKVSVKMESLSELEKNLLQLDLRASFDTLAFCQNPERYPEYFKNRPYQSAEISLPVIISEALKKQGGIVNVGYSSGIYFSNKRELIALFMQLQLLLKSKSTLDQRIAFILKDSDHAIFVGYCPRTKLWAIINANNLASQVIYEEALSATGEALLEEIANKLASTVTSDINMAFSEEMQPLFIEMYMGQSGSEEMKKSIIEWQNSEEWKTLHTITREKATAINHKGITWLHLSLKHSHTPPEFIHLLLQNGANPNLPDAESSLLSAAIRFHGKEVVTLLLDHGANPNLLDPTGAPILFVAAEEKKPELVQLLLDKGANINITNKNGWTTLHFAFQIGDKSVVERLLANGASLQNGFVSQTHILLNFAAHSGRKEQVEIWIKNKNQGELPRVLNDLTVLHIAVFFGHIDLVTLLLDKGEGADTSALELAHAMNHIEIINNLEKFQALKSTSIFSLFSKNKSDSESSSYSSHAEPTKAAQI